MKKTLSVILVVVLVLSVFSGCTSSVDKDREDSSDSSGKNKTSVVHEPEAKPIRMASSATALALRQYIYARLKTEEFLAVDYKSISVEEYQDLIDDLVAIWEETDVITISAEEITDQALLVVESPNFKQTGSFIPPKIFSMEFVRKPFIFQQLFMLQKKKE